MNKKKTRVFIQWKLLSHPWLWHDVWNTSPLFRNTLERTLHIQLHMMSLKPTRFTSTFPLCKTFLFFSPCFYFWPLSSLESSPWMRSVQFFKFSTCPTFELFKKKNLPRRRCYTLVSSPFMSTEHWSLSLWSLLEWDEWECFFFGRMPSSSCTRRATSGDRWRCLPPGGGGW